MPSETPVVPGHFLVARLEGIDFEGLFRSPDFDFHRPFDARFAKMMVRTASHLLGGDACGKYAFTEHSEISVLLERRVVAARWREASELQCFLVALASTKMSLQVEGEAIFGCRLYAFPTPDLVVAYFLWRQQEANLRALDSYCSFVLSRDHTPPEKVAKLLEGLGPREKEEVLRQNDIEYTHVPPWQRSGAAVRLTDNGSRVAVEANLPSDAEYAPYLQQYLE